jgi:hypothetical protein
MGTMRVSAEIRVGPYTAQADFNSTSLLFSDIEHRLLAQHQTCP